MPLTSDDKSFLKLIYNRLKPDEPLDPGDIRYEDVYDRPDCDDPTSEIFSKIELSNRESTLFFSGFSGSGKTTELRRLRKRLVDENYFVLYADALDYINPALPIQISDLLIVLAGAFSEALEAQGIDIGRESYWTRFCNYRINTNVELKEISQKVDLDLVKVGLGLKLELRSTPSFRERLALALADRVGSLRDDVLPSLRTATKQSSVNTTAKKLSSSSIPSNRFGRPYPPNKPSFKVWSPCSQTTCACSPFPGSTWSTPSRHG